MSQEAMKLALNKAFQLGQRYWSWADSEYSSHWKKADAAKAEFDQLVQDTINAALAEHPSQQEPFAWADINALTAQFNSVNCGTAYRLPGEGRQPLYTSPPPCPTCEALARTVMLDQTSHDAQRKPLPCETLIELWCDASLANSGSGWFVVSGAFARAIEAAHGIGEKK